MDREAVIRQLLDGLPYPAAFADGEGKIAYRNRGFVEDFGYDAATCPDLATWFPMAYPDPAYREDALRRWHACLDPEQGIIKADEYRVRCADGSDRVVEIFGSLYDGLTVVIFRDLTLIRAEQAKSELSAAFNAAIVDNAAEGICVCDALEEPPFCRFTVWNNRMVEITGYTREEINRLGWFDAVHHDADARAAAVERLARAHAGRNLRAEPVKIRDKSGATRSLAISTSLVRDENGKAHVLGLMQDFTLREAEAKRQKDLETKILQAQRLESLGVLAGGIAHDFNNLLAVMVGHAELAQSDLDETSNTAASLREIMAAGERARQLTDQMLAYVGKSTFVTRDCDLNDIVRRCGEVARARRDQVNVVLSLDTSLPACRGDLPQLRQVIDSIIANANEALAPANAPGKAREIEVTSRALRCERGLHPARRKQGILGRPLPNGTYVSLQVRDTGAGIDAMTLERIFEPFFSTKFQGRGLSLAAVLGVLRTHDGEIFVDSQQGLGSTFEILLPTQDTILELGAGQSEELYAANIRPPKQQRTALVVDDEAMVRQVATRMLEHDGFTVLEAADGLQALEVLERLGHAVDVVLLDLTMPRLDGIETLRRLQESKYPGAVVLMSGYARGALSNDLGGSDAVSFLQKPFRARELRAIVSSALSAAAGQSPS